MVLRPNSADGSCSLSLEYTQPHDQSVAPSLVIEMANPRILVLFRQGLLTGFALFQLSLPMHEWC